MNKPNLEDRILRAVNKSVTEFFRQYRIGVHYDWKEPGPPKWKMWDIVDLERDLQKEPEIENIKAQLRNLSVKITDILVQRTRAKKPTRLIRAEIEMVTRQRYASRIK